MFNIYNNRYVKNFMSIITLATFSMSLIPMHLSAFEEREMFTIGFNEINFGVRMEKLIEKAKKYVQAEDSNSLIDTMFDIKFETECYTNVHISLSDKIKEVEKAFSKEGVNIPKNVMEKIKKTFKEKEKKIKHKSMYIETCMKYGIEYNAADEIALYEAKKDKNKDEPEEEVYIPVRLIVGVTTALCGLFCAVVPIAPLNAASNYLMATGVGLAGDAIMTIYDQNEKEKHEKKELVIA